MFGRWEIKFNSLIPSPCSVPCFLQSGIYSGVSVCRVSSGPPGSTSFCLASPLLWWGHTNLWGVNVLQSHNFLTAMPVSLLAMEAPESQPLIDSENLFYIQKKPFIYFKYGILATYWRLHLQRSEFRSKEKPLSAVGFIILRGSGKSNDYNTFPALKIILINIYWESNMSQACIYMLRF